MSFGSFLMACSFNIKVHTQFEQHCQALRVTFWLWHFVPLYLTHTFTKIFVVPPKEMLLLLSIGTFLTNYVVINRKLQSSLHTPLYKNEQNDREIIQWRLLSSCEPDLFWQVELNTGKVRYSDPNCICWWKQIQLPNLNSEPKYDRSYSDRPHLQLPTKLP